MPESPRLSVPLSCRVVVYVAACVGDLPFGEAEYVPQRTRVEAFAHIDVSRLELVERKRVLGLERQRKPMSAQHIAGEFDRGKLAATFAKPEWAYVRNPESIVPAPANADTRFLALKGLAPDEDELRRRCRRAGIAVSGKPAEPARKSARAPARIASFDC